MHSRTTSYLVGFTLSVALTLLAFFVTSRPEIFSLRTSLVSSVIMLLAVIQLVVQLICFLHIDSESGHRLKLLSFISTISIVIIVVVGSIWIMNHLNYNMMAMPDQMNQYIHSQDGF